MTIHKDTSFGPFPIYYLGPSLDIKGQSTFLYFSISGQESLSLSPFNQIADLLHRKGIRILSWTLPGHHEEQDKNIAMSYWAEHLQELKTFIQMSHKLLDELFDRQVITSDHFAVGGLSRGGFIATHLLCHPKVNYGLGIAPLLDLRCLTEGQKLSDEELKGLALEPLCETLYTKKLYYLIGNRDERVSTDKAFQFLRTLVNYAYDKRVRSPQIEMKIFPSTGYQGHGSLPHVFEEGAKWIFNQIHQDVD